MSVFACLFFCGLALAQTYPEYIANHFAKQQTGNVGVVAIVSDGTFVTANAPSATLNLDKNTMWEVGSTTKTFTTLCVELLVDQGKLSMNETLATYLPKTVKMSPAVGAITLKQLATHTSGLARMPSNLIVAANYTTAMMYTYLSGLTDADLGPKTFLYSNTGNCFCV